MKFSRMGSKNVQRALAIVFLAMMAAWGAYGLYVAIFQPQDAPKGGPGARVRMSAGAR